MLSRVQPGDIAASLPPQRARATASPSTAIFSDFERVIVPGLTHWNHPGFFAYFAITGSGPGVLAEIPVGRAQRAGDAVADVTGGDRARGGRARVAARADRAAGRRSRASSTTPPPSRRCTRWPPRARRPSPPSRRTGSRAARPAAAARLLLRTDALARSTRRVHHARARADAIAAQSPADAAVPHAPRRARAPPSRKTVPRGALPIAVVATVGTTSSTSIDPVAAIADVCERRALWLHVDAAYAGVMAMVPDWRHILRRRRARRLARGQPAQVAVHAVRPERLLLPAHGRRPRRVLARRRST